jgi:hypothetical protein
MVNGTGMDNPFLLAIALLENQKIATGFFPGIPDRGADSSNGVINWHLLVEDTVAPDVRDQMLSLNNARCTGAANPNPKLAILAHKPALSRIVCGRHRWAGLLRRQTAPSGFRGKSQASDSFLGEAKGVSQFD